MPIRLSGLLLARPPAYAPLTRFAAAARPRTELWRSVLGTVLIGALYLMAIISFFQFVERVWGPWTAARLSQGIASGSTPQALTMLLFSFAAMGGAVFVVTRLLHGRSGITLFGPLPQALSDFLHTALPILALWVVLLPLSALAPEVGRHLTVGQLLVWLPLALPGLLIQIGSEELLFRGYLQQQLAARFQAPLAWAVLPSMLFGALHYAPAEFGRNASLMALWATLFGLFAADLTARTGNLGAALGFHFATNFSAIFLVGLYGNLDGLALFNLVINTRDPGQVIPFLAVDFMSMLVSWLLARQFLCR